MYATEYLKDGRHTYTHKDGYTSGTTSIAWSQTKTSGFPMFTRGYSIHAGKRHLERFLKALRCTCWVSRNIASSSIIAKEWLHTMSIQVTCQRTAVFSIPPLRVGGSSYSITYYIRWLPIDLWIYSSGSLEANVLDVCAIPSSSQPSSETSAIRSERCNPSLSHSWALSWAVQRSAFMCKVYGPMYRAHHVGTKKYSAILQRWVSRSAADTI